MATQDSPQDEPTTEEVDAPEMPDRPSGVSNEEWADFRSEFKAFAERVEKGLTARRPAAPKASQTVEKPSRKPEPKEEEKTPEKAPEKPKRKRGYWD